MLFTLFVVVVTYLLAAESFTHFLFPAARRGRSPLQVRRFTRCGFRFLGRSGCAYLIVLGWILIYANAHGSSIRLPQWVNALQVRLYLLLMNRLYLDALSLTNFGRRLTRMA